MVQRDYVLMLYHCPYLLPLRKTKEASKQASLMQCYSVAGIPLICIVVLSMVHRNKDGTAK